MARAIILLLDSFGIGHAADAERFGDKGADTLGHICEWMAVLNFYICLICRCWGLKKPLNLAAVKALRTA